MHRGDRITVDENFYSCRHADGGRIVGPARNLLHADQFHRSRDGIWPLARRDLRNRKSLGGGTPTQAQVVAFPLHEQVVDQDRFAVVADGGAVQTDAAGIIDESVIEAGHAESGGGRSVVAPPIDRAHGEGVRTERQVRVVESHREARRIGIGVRRIGIPHVGSQAAGGNIGPIGAIDGQLDPLDALGSHSPAPNVPDAGIHAAAARLFEAQDDLFAGGRWRGGRDQAQPQHRHAQPRPSPRWSLVHVAFSAQDNKKAAPPRATFTLVALGSPAFLNFRIRDFLSLSHNRFGFGYLDII